MGTKTIHTIQVVLLYVYDRLIHCFRRHCRKLSSIYISENRQIISRILMDLELGTIKEWESHCSVVIFVRCYYSQGLFDRSSNIQHRCLQKSAVTIHSNASVLLKQKRPLLHLKIMSCTPHLQNILFHAGVPCCLSTKCPLWRWMTFAALRFVLFNWLFLIYKFCHQLIPWVNKNKLA